MRPVLLACMTQAPWRQLSNKSNPLHLWAMYLVVHRARRESPDLLSQGAPRSETLREATFPIWPLTPCEPARPVLGRVTFRPPILGSHSGSALRPNSFQQGPSSPGLFPHCRRRTLDSQHCSMPALEAFGEGQILVFVGLDISSPNYHIPVLPPPSREINQKCPDTFPKALTWQLLVGNI